jgi:hypothetical protein
MSDYRYFKSPWGKSLIVMTGLSCLILIGMSVFGLIGGPCDVCTGRLSWNLMMIGMPLGILFGGMLFMIRGYELTDNAIYVQRLLWRTKIDLSGLKSVDVHPEAMSKSLRTFGNGGLFSFSGAYWNKSLGHYRAYATDLNNCVVLRFEKKVAVVTPQDPEKFASCIKEYKNL